MEKINKERYLIKILKELALEHKLTIRFFCFDWLIELSNPHHKFHILGYDWAINSATAQAIAKDKSACFEILKANQVPSIEHFLFLSPEFQSFIGANGNWKKIIDFAQKHDNKIVIKSNMGTGGNEVFLVSNQAELEGCVQALFSKHRAIAICPFYDIHNEYRVILLDEEPLLCYNKIKPFIVGNGENTLLELILQHKGEFDLKDIFTQKIDFNIVLLRGKKFELNWKHNLGKGASPEITTILR